MGNELLRDHRLSDQGRKGEGVDPEEAAEVDQNLEGKLLLLLLQMSGSGP